MTSKQDGNYLYVAWDDKPPLESHNVWRCKSNIDFQNGKAIFEIANGSVVKIDVEQLTTIGMTGNRAFYYKGDDESREDGNEN